MKLFDSAVDFIAYNCDTQKADMNFSRVKILNKNMKHCFAKTISLIIKTSLKSGCFILAISPNFFVSN